jgi:hypothetical protein
MMAFSGGSASAAARAASAIRLATFRDQRCLQPINVVRKCAKSRIHAKIESQILPDSKKKKQPQMLHLSKRKSCLDNRNHYSCRVHAPADQGPVSKMPFRLYVEKACRAACLHEGAATDQSL